MLIRCLPLSVWRKSGPAQFVHSPSTKYNWCWKIWGGEKTDRVGKKLTCYFFLPGKRMTSQFLPRGRNGPAWSFPRERLVKGEKLTITPVPDPETLSLWKSWLTQLFLAYLSWRFTWAEGSQGELIVYQWSIGGGGGSIATESPHWLIMGKMMSPPFLGHFWSDPILFILAGNEDMHKIEFQPDRTIDYRVSCLEV